MSCKIYRCDLAVFRAAGRLLWFSGRGTDAWGAESPASGGSSTEGQAVQVVPERLRVNWLRYKVRTR